MLRFQFKADATAELNKANFFTLTIVLLHSWFLTKRTTEGKCPIFPAHYAKTNHYLETQNKLQQNYPQLGKSFRLGGKTKNIKTEKKTGENYCHVADKNS